MSDHDRGVGAIFHLQGCIKRWPMPMQRITRTAGNHEGSRGVFSFH